MFGYDYQDVSSDGFRYAMVMVDGREVGGIGQYPAETPASVPAAWRVYFAVDDTDAAVAAAVAHGGRLRPRPRRARPAGTGNRRQRPPAPKSGSPPPSRSADA